MKFQEPVQLPAFVEVVTNVSVVLKGQLILEQSRRWREMAVKAKTLTSFARRADCTVWSESSCCAGV
jgi:hypothetical protein